MKEAENDKMDTKSCLFFFVSFCAFYEEEDEEGNKNFLIRISLHSFPIKKYSQYSMSTQMIIYYLVYIPTQNEIFMSLL